MRSKHNGYRILVLCCVFEKVGDASVSGRIEAFSCKRAGEDKKLSKMLEAQVGF